ncbi:MAG: hypothetical protein RL086_235 [Bacteroidota bacterium]|jgi:hypothetical protein
MVLLENLDYKMKNVIFLLLISSIFSVRAQNNTNGNVKQIQPKIVVVPYVPNGEDIRSKIEANPNLRLAISLVKKAFDQRGYTTYDFLTSLKSAEESNMRSNSNSTMLSKNEIINKYTKAEIEVQIDYVELAANKDGKQVQIVLSANVVGEASAFANEPFNSKRLNVELNELMIQAINSNIDAFMSTMQTKFTEIVNDGISYYLELQISNGESFKFNDELPGENDQFSFIIYDWMRNNAHNNYANMDDESETQLTFTIKIPLRDTKTGLNYTITDFQRSFRNFLKTKMYDVKFAKTEGKKLYAEVKKL